MSNSEPHQPPDPTVTHRMPPISRADWDQRYAESEQIWSGNPNGLLVTEAADLAPGRALDVGCGEGADAIWLAQRGWAVTAFDISAVALDRGRAAAAAAGVEIDWLLAGLLDPMIESLVADHGPFDLVSVFYPALLKTPDQLAEQALLSAVAPGGTLLFVHHADIDREHALENGFDPELYVAPEDVTAAVDRSVDSGQWQVIGDRRERDITAGAGAHHHHDLLLRATRHD